MTWMCFSIPIPFLVSQKALPARPCWRVDVLKAGFRLTGCSVGWMYRWMDALLAECSVWLDDPLDGVPWKDFPWMDVHWPHVPWMDVSQAETLYNVAKLFNWILSFKPLWKFLCLPFFFLCLQFGRNSILRRDQNFSFQTITCWWQWIWSLS